MASNTGAIPELRGRRSRQVRIVEMSAEESRPVLRAFAVKVPVGVGFAGIEEAGAVEMIADGPLRFRPVSPGVRLLVVLSDSYRHGPGAVKSG